MFVYNTITYIFCTFAFLKMTLSILVFDEIEGTFLEEILFRKYEEENQQ